MNSNDNETIEATAEHILEEGRQLDPAPSPIDPAPSPIDRARADGVKLTTGSERADNAPKTYDPAQFLDKPAPARPTLPSPRTGSGGGHGQYVTAPGLSSLHSRLQAARRRDDAAVVGETKAAASAWANFTEAADQAEAALRSIPAVMRDAAAKRTQAADEADEPVVLPSVEEARAWAEARASKAIRAALALREAYDDAVEETAGDRLAALAKTVPSQAEEIRQRVDGLTAAVTALRISVATLTDAASHEPGKRGKRMPTAVRLGDVLDELTAEVEQLLEIAEQPSEPAITPSVTERRAIIRRSHGAVSGLTDEVLDLARRERAEGYKHTALTRGIPAGMLENYAASRANFGGSYIR